MRLEPIPKKEVIIIENRKILNKFDKDKTYKAELKKLTEIFKDISKDKLQIAESLIDQAAFMAATLKELSLFIDRDGSVSFDDKGNLKESPAVKTYTALINRYTNAVKQLLDLLPKSPPDSNNDDKKVQDELLTFIKNK